MKGLLHITYAAAALLLLLLSEPAGSQPRDTRALISAGWGLEELTISPDGTLWLVSSAGKTYYTQDLRAGWHEGPVFRGKEGDSSGRSVPNLGQISFFNRQTAIISGSIDQIPGSGDRDGIFRTSDGGKTWTPVNFGAFEWIYDAFADPSGRAWMGGSSGFIHYSEDFGKSWVRMHSPFSDDTRTSGIRMYPDGLRGVAGAMSNALYRTADNWKTSIRIPTPRDQAKISAERNLNSDDRIMGIGLWKGWLVVNQNGRAFYSDTAKTNWHEFPVRLSHFSIDAASGRLFAISRDGEAFSFTTPADYNRLTEYRVSAPVLDLKAAGGIVYILDNRPGVTQIDAQGMYGDLLYSLDQHIGQPRTTVTTSGGSLVWGLTLDELFMSDNGGRDWYRETPLPRHMFSLSLENDSVAILYDFNQNNFSYDLRTHTLSPYEPQAPLEAFLAAPVKSIRISAGSSGCFHKNEDIATFSFGNSGRLEQTGLSRNGKPFPANGAVAVVSSNRLSGVLQAINKHPAHMPALTDFDIRQKDIRAYRELIRESLEGDDGPVDLTFSPVDRKFLKAFPERLDTISDATLHRVLKVESGELSTTRNWMDVRLINGRGDTLHVFNHYYNRNTPWHLPWSFRYEGKYFKSYDARLSRLIRDCLPATFYGRQYLDNSYLLLAIAMYLGEKE